MGYGLLLEKVIAQTWDQCNDILQAAKKNSRIVAVCHVLRYTPYFRKLKEVTDSGALGEIVSLQHFEPVEHIHMSHSFVRGNWRNSKESNPIILSKSCHDLDILRWTIGKPCRCVYHCDNDVVDHQVVNMEFEGEITAAFSMEAFTSCAGRRTRVMGTKGDAVGDMTTLALYDFKKRTQTVWDASHTPESQSGHGGGDFGLAHDFVRAVSQQDPTLLTSTIEASMESHLMGFKAEESRLSGATVEVRMG